MGWWLALALAWAGPKDESALASYKVQLACERGDGDACVRFAFLLLTGFEAPADPTRAIEILHDSCEKDHAESCYRHALARRYWQGANELATREDMGKACDLGWEAACTEFRLSGEPTPAEEEAANALYTEAQAAGETADFETGKTKLEELERLYPNTKANKRAARLRTEWSVIGIDVGQIEVQQWYQGMGQFDSRRLTLAVFFETWCPHCKREIPQVEERYQRLKSKGLDVVAFTKVSKSSTDAKVYEFIAENQLTFPVGREASTSMSDRFQVSGIPAAALIWKGKVVWRGHPARITDELLNQWLPGK